MMQRRDFIRNCTLICAGGIGLSFLLESCGSIHYAAYKTEANKIAVNINEFIDAQKGDRKFVVIKTDKLQFPICLYHINNEYFAVYMQCTHQGCELQPNKISLVCPCHGSEFTNKGKVLNPPADKDLKTFKVIYDDKETIYIEI